MLGIGAGSFHILRLSPPHMSRYFSEIQSVVENHRRPDRVAWLLSCAVAAMICSGCTTFMGKNHSPAEKIDMTPVKKEGYTVGPYGVMQPLPQADDSPSIILEVNRGKRTFEKVPLVPNQPMFVADLVRDADLQRKIGRIQVTILRPNGSNPPVRMDVDFDAAGKRVEEGMNYSLRAGDHVIVTADSTNFMSRVASGTVFGRTSK